MSKKENKTTRYRSAITGKFITEEQAKKHPKQSIKDTMKRSEEKDSSKKKKR